MEVNRLSVQYILPGHEAEVNSSSELGGLEQYESADFPEQHVGRGQISSPGNWRDLLGLNASFLGPTQIDPPVLPPAINASSRPDIARSYRVFAQAAEASADFKALPKLRQMFDLLVRSQQAADAIRSRSLQGRTS